ncbi:MAG: phosphatase PAP2 family protein [Mycolicibacterium rufum]|uniref:Undecaprenyl pyrophosphate phosphatase n=1 Tax=Mycolicibacterium chlorophenolicum TaxID=37916 RepID=A0A0J6VKJ2_9MYCO|nr:phosphatase PAP2 family protein [Mycolicibacterium chlorophenolicum]KMO70784.1 undecaprenyl pyrophosphate phosphatase [Mycolicibacterium chlorophenolicum]MBI5340918.1 phosphatase PAP2 family protein [Mycolicibacterium rufum]
MTIPAVRHRSAGAAILAGVLLTLFAVLSLLAHQVRSGTGFDHAVLDAMLTHRNPMLTTWTLAITTVFSPVGTAVLAVVAASLVWLRLGSLRPPLVVLATVAGAGAVSTLTKIVVGAHRPPAGVQLISETDHSFPSGHVTATVSLFGVLAVVAGHHWGPATRAAWAAVTAVTAGAVGFTRLYLGVHWAIDVLGGLVLGAAATMLAHLAYRRMMEPRGAGGSSSTEDAIATGVS